MGAARSRTIAWLAASLVVLGACSKPRQVEPAALQVPSEAAVVATLSLEKLRASPQWPALETAFAAQLPLEDIKRTCPSDPVKSIQTIQLALADEMTPERAIVTVRGLSRAAADSCAKSFAATQNQMITISDDGGIAAYRQGEAAVHVAWLDGSTFAIAPDALTSKDRLNALGKRGAPRDAALAAALEHLPGTHLVELAFSARPETGLARFLAGSGMEPDSGYGWIDLDKTLRGELVLAFATPQRAASAAARTLEGPLAKVKATQREREVTFSLALDETETAQLLGQLMTMAR